jgi:UDP-2,3-diacylglucosamine pyrophosphatase LpxH
MKRAVDILVLSDLHLGTYGCNAKELLHYLESVDPKTVILNGDIIDIWHFSKRSWPKYHTKVVQYFINWISEGKVVKYLPGNHDEAMRRFNGFSVNNFEIANKTVETLEDGRKAWIFHGDVFDVTMKGSKWLAKLGGNGYNILIFINRVINWFSLKLTNRKVSLSKSIKNGVKSAIKRANNFELTAAEIAAHNGYHFVICGHIHQPIIKSIETKKGTVTYLNSGDWIENLTSLEFTNGEWSIFRYNESELAKNSPKLEVKLDDLDSAILFKMMVEEFNKDHAINAN